MENMCWWMTRLKNIKNYNKYIKILSQLRVSSDLDRRYFQVRDRIKEGKLRVSFCPTSSNLADFFTKGLPTPKFKQFKFVIMNFVSSAY